MPDLANGIRTIPVRAPFPNVSMHVEKSPRIWGVGGDWGWGIGLQSLGHHMGDTTRCPPSRVIVEHAHGAVGLVSPVEHAPSSSPACVLPFGLCWKSITSLSLEIEGLDESHGIIPGDPFHRTIPSAILEVGGVGSHYPLPLRLGDLGCLHVKGPSEDHFVLGLIPVSKWLILRASHGEASRGEENELHPQGIGEHPELLGIARCPSRAICHDPEPNKCRDDPLSPHGIQCPSPQTIYVDTHGFKCYSLGPALLLSIYQRVRL